MFYKQKSYNAAGEVIYKYSSECKECKKKLTKLWRLNNPDKHKIIYMKRNATEVNQKSMRRIHKQRAEEGKYREWQLNNKGKTRVYNQKRRNKNHDITIKEWDSCRLYFNYRCAYCGMTYEEHIERVGTDLHKEHLDPFGKNDLSNCVPACYSCNSSKWQYEFSDWYSKYNHRFEKEKEIKILQWVNNDHKKALF